MSVETLLNMTCTIERSTKGRNKSGETIDDWDNQPSGFPNTGVACRYQALSGSERFEGSGAVGGTGGGQGIMIEGKLFLATGVDLTEEDRIVDVVGSGGTTIASRADVDRVNHDPGGQLNHTEIWLREVRTF